MLKRIVCIVLLCSYFSYCNDDNPQQPEPRSPLQKFRETPIQTTKEVASHILWGTLIMTGALLKDARDFITK